jgi:hypothetical protein
LLSFSLIVLATGFVQIISSATLAPPKINLSIPSYRDDLLSVTGAGNYRKLAISAKSIAHAEALSHVLTIDYITFLNFER